MRLIGFVIVACIALAVLRVAAAVIALLLIGFVIVAAIRNPMQTFGCLLMFACLGLIGTYPIPGLAIVGGLIVLGLLSRGREDK